MPIYAKTFIAILFVNLIAVTSALGQGVDNASDMWLKTFLKGQAIHPDLQVKMFKPAKQISGSNPGQIITSDYQFYLRDVPLCSYLLRIHRLSNLANPIVLGELPPNLGEIGLQPVATWPSAKSVNAALKGDLQKRKRGFRSFATNLKDRCLYYDKENLKAAWRVGVILDGLPYEATAGEDNVYAWKPRFFDVDGSALVYEKNSDDGELKTFPLKNLVGNGFLQNRHFRTFSQKPRAYSLDHDFAFDPSSPEFDETSAFVHVNVQADFFAKLGYKWGKKEKVDILLNYVDESGSPNNAFYMFATDGKPPLIAVGDGDGKRFANLATDADVLSHELSHHFIFNYLDAGQQEALVMHEGLADFFTFARTDDPCLAESVCLAANDNCAIRKQCLRSADNNYSIATIDKIPDFYAHEKSQFISGLLWELRTKELINKAKFDTLVFTAVTLLHPSSGYHDLILTLMLADKQLYDGRLCKEILAVATDRGLNESIADLNCKNLKKAKFKDGKPETKLQDDKNALHRVSRDQLVFCGVASKASNAQKIFWTVLFLLLPLMSILISTVRNSKNNY